MTATTRRLFFAFWPDERIREALEAARNRIFPLSGRPVALAGLHVTAAFLGAVSEARLPALLALCGPVPRLTITFDRLEHWPKPRVLVAATTHLPDDLRDLVDGLWLRLDRLGFARETRPFRPHVTLARDVRSVRAGLRWDPLPWPVDRLALIESVPAPDGVIYRPVAAGAVAG
ncbi:MAG: RNA 2',3'-cyclic phosphodiesterase [Gammaproteobacteria bacterium]|nr:RNA 2',3'-cyclic phosphodiesterase [Gammaproteobacteria bacterium]